MVCDVAEIAAGVGLVWARRGVVGVPGVEVSVALASAGSAWLVPVDAEVLFSTGSAVAFVLLPSSALPVLLLVASACDCCSAVS